MLESNIHAVNNDVKALVTDAQALFHAAADLTGEKAEDVRKRGMRMLEAAIENTHEAEERALGACKKMAASTDGYVHDNPWRAIAASASLGLLAGVLLARR